jgi:hypothetical protein
MQKKATVGAVKQKLYYLTSFYLRFPKALYDASFILFFLISVPKNRASCVLRHSKLVLCLKTTCSAEGWAILRSRIYL